MSKEATVEPRHITLAEEALGDPEVLFQGEYTEAVNEAAFAIASAERRGAAKAWDEGYVAATEDSLIANEQPRAMNPYRPEPAKGDSK